MAKSLVKKKVVKKRVAAKWYKVLVPYDGKLTGGHTSFNYRDYLPRAGKAGKWLPFIPYPIPCQAGWHITKSPSAWYRSYGRVFVAKSKGEDRSSYNKKACQSIQLIREVKKGSAEWKRLRLPLA